MADEDDKAYRWETDYERTWEVLTEDASGSLKSSVDDVLHQAKRRKLLQRPKNVRLGMMRHLYVILDMSAAMEDQDLKPTRLHSCVKLLEHFVEEYFDQNPISQLGVITTRSKRSEILSDLGGNPRRHITALRGALKIACQGEPSLQNALQLAASTLKHMPSHTSRETLIIMGSLTTCDPGDIQDTIQMLNSQNIRCSVIGLAAHIHVCRKLCHSTNGQYNVLLDESHFKDLLAQQVAPPPATANTESSLIKMGFPHHQLSGAGDHEELPALCMCHLDSADTGPGLSTRGYVCPQCKSTYCELPTECKVCSLTLVSAPHLARSYHHLFPLQSFAEVQPANLPPQLRFCKGCRCSLKDSTCSQCSQCQSVFCVDCDIFVHESLHCCPGCASSRVHQGAV